MNQFYLLTLSRPGFWILVNNRNNLENSLIYTVFRSQRENMENFENVFFFKLKPLISLSNFNILSSSFCKRPHFQSRKGFCNKKMWSWQCSAGVVIFGDTTLQGARMGVPFKRFSKFSVKYFLKVIILKVKHIQATFKHLFQSNLLCCGSLGPPTG